jgi:hypothetical protein
LTPTSKKSRRLKDTLEPAVAPTLEEAERACAVFRKAGLRAD